MNHAAAQDFQPVRIPVFLTGPGSKGNIYFRRRFGEGEIAGPETDLRVGAKKVLQEDFQGPLEVCKADALIHYETFDLVEYGRMGGIVIPAEHLARGNHADWRIGCMLPESSRLYRRCMGAEKNIRRNVEGILHIPGRMVLRQVQAFEIVVILFDFRPLFYGIAHADEGLHDFPKRLVQGMEMADLLVPGRKSDIYGFVFNLFFQPFRLQFLHLGSKGFFHVAPDLVCHGTDYRPLGSGEILHAPEDSGELAFLAQEKDPGILQALFIHGGCDFFLCILLQGIQVHLHKGNDLIPYFVSQSVQRLPVIAVQLLHIIQEARQFSLHLFIGFLLLTVIIADVKHFLGFRLQLIQLIVHYCTSCIFYKTP